MATAKKGGTQFLIGARITVETNCVVRADSLEEALDIGRTLKLSDFIEIKGDHNDSSLKIDSIFEN